MATQVMQRAKALGNMQLSGTSRSVSVGASIRLAKPALPTRVLQQKSVLLPQKRLQRLLPVAVSGRPSGGAGRKLPGQPEDAAPEAVAAPEPAAPPAPAAQSYSKEFTRTRLITFFFLFIGYGATYLTRLSLAYVAPALMADKALGLDMKAIGGLTSILPIAYGFSKFGSGVLGARTSPTVLLAGGLAATALANIGFGVSNAYLLFCIFWGVNGILQGLGAPACARLLTTWFAGKERGTYWSFWTASNNIGGFAAPLLVGWAAKTYGWRWGMFAPGLVALVVAALVFTFMKDSPEAAGYPPVEAPKAPAKPKADGTTEKKPGMIETLMKECLRNPYVWLFAITYFFVYVVRQGVTSWFIFYLINAKDVADGAAAAVRVSGLELGGLLGSLSAGTLSDLVLRRNEKNGGKGGNVGLRVQVCMAYSFGTACVLAAFWAAPNVPALQWLLVAAIGFFLYGPQMLIGLIGAETVSPIAVGACQGFLGWISYLGAANAGVPLAFIVQSYGWNAFFAVLIGACVVQLVLLAPMVNLKSYVQAENEKLQLKAA